MRCFGRFLTTISTLAILAVVTISTQGQEVEVQKTPDTLLYIRTVPSGAKILVDGQPKGSDQLIELPDGTDRVVVEVQWEGQPGERHEIVVRSGKVTRVKFLQKTPSATVAAGDGTSPKGLAFGPVRQMQSPVLQHGTAVLLDLETGKTVTMEGFGADDAQTQAWVREHHVDLLAFHSQEKPGIFLFDAVVAEVPADQWDRITPDQLSADSRLCDQKPKDIAPIVAEGGQTPTRIFRTREGRYGILQVLALEDESFVQFRFKLVESADKKGHVPADKADQASQRRFVRLVVGRGVMTFEGEKTTWEELPKLLEQVPDRKHTVLEVAFTSNELLQERRQEVLAKGAALAKELGFEYASLIGIHPLGSKAAGSRTFVRLVIGTDKLTFEGEDTTWEALPKLLERVPDRKHTVLEIAVSGNEIPHASVVGAIAVAAKLEFASSSMIGVHPLGSKGTPASADGPDKPAVEAAPAAAR